MMATCAPLVGLKAALRNTCGVHVLVLVLLVLRLLYVLLLLLLVRKKQVLLHRWLVLLKRLELVAFSQGGRHCLLAWGH